MPFQYAQIVPPKDWLTRSYASYLFICICPSSFLITIHIASTYEGFRNVYGQEILVVVVWWQDAIRAKSLCCRSYCRLMNHTDIYALDSTVFVWTMVSHHLITVTIYRESQGLYICGFYDIQGTRIDSC